MTRILIADDNSTIRHSLRGLIENRSEWQVCGEARDGAEAVTRTKELKPDLIVLDFSMPVMNGLQAAREIAKIEPKIPILLFSIHLSAELVAEARKAGVEGAVSKLQSKLLLDGISALLRSENYFQSIDMN